MNALTGSRIKAGFGKNDTGSTGEKISFGSIPAGGVACVEQLFLWSNTFTYLSSSINMFTYTLQFDPKHSLGTIHFSHRYIEDKQKIEVDVIYAENLDNGNITKLHTDLLRVIISLHVYLLKFSTSGFSTLILYVFNLWN